MTHDYIVRGLAYGGEIRAYAAITTESVQEAQTRHYTWPSAFYGKNYDSYCYDGCVKRKSKLTVTVDGKGPIGRIIADADAQGNVHAYVDHPQTHFPLNDQGKLDVRRAVELMVPFRLLKMLE